MEAENGKQAGERASQANADQTAPGSSNEATPAPAPTPTDDGPQRILIVRLSAIGDVVHGMPVLCALRERFPKAELAWLVERQAADLLDGHRALNKLFVVPKGWLKSFSTVRRVRRQLREFRPEVTLDLQGLTKSALAAWLSGAKRRIGFGDEKGRELSRFLNNERLPASALHVVDSNLKLLRPFGIESPRVRFMIPEHKADAKAAETVMADAGLEQGFAILNPGAGWPSKLWPVERYSEVARHLGEKRKLPSLVVWAGIEERRWARTIVEQSSGHARAATETTLRQLGALARRARVFIGSDTGPLHIAAGVGTPCVGLYGPMSAQRNGPYGPQHIAIQEKTFEGTSRERRNAPRSLMEAIGAEKVCEAADEILDRKKHSAA
jgi:lipopolysaccharide heptosyltransferase I